MKNVIRRAKNRIIGSLGSMQKYYMMVEKCENCSRKKARFYRDRVMWYAKLVSTKPFLKEKEIEKNKIWKAIQEGTLDDLFSNEVNYIKKKGVLSLYPYPFSELYTVTPEEVYDDIQLQLCYVIHNGKRLYFPKGEHKVIAAQYQQLIMEQDKESPHRYFDDEIPYCDVFVDVGCAEGIISLDAIDRAKDIYLLECSEKWIRALNATFKDYQDKVHIVRKYGGEYSDRNNICLDDLLADYTNKKIVIKMDIEGMEEEALRGCINIMKKNECYISCTTYHTNTSYEKIESFFVKNDYECNITKNYMLFIYGNMTLANGKYQRMEYPFFRHGVIRGYKKPYLKGN